MMMLLERPAFRNLQNILYSTSTVCSRVRRRKHISCLHSRFFKKSHFHSSCTLKNQDQINKSPSTLKNKIIFSGIQPTGIIHLGNYFGAIQQWVNLQNNNEDVICSIVDLHAITLSNDPVALKNDILTMAASLFACGIDPHKATLFQQSKVPEHSQLNWVLNCLATMDRLKRQPQFKEKSKSLKVIPMGLFSYPVLQAADILLYQTTHVPVGKDQEQHIFLSAELARKFNNLYGETFQVPECLTLDENLGRVRNLRKPELKMSKSSRNSKSRIEILDSPDLIKEKIKKAMTDFTSEVYYDFENRLGVSNLMTIHSAITGQTFDEIREEYAGVQTSDYKLSLADIVIEYLLPMQKKMKELLSDKENLKQMLEIGNNKARSRASVTWEIVSERVGFK